MPAPNTGADDTLPHGFNLDRFVSAQTGDYDRAVSELRRGRKTSHWMWFIFPQIAGLGHSATARHYAISDLDEARAYLAHPVLGPRLTKVSRILLEIENRSARDVFGTIDTQKLRSSMTLFDLAQGADDPGSVFAQVLEKYFDGRLDDATIALV
jgi:uncharacterized protein (DUF1810 family)